MKSFLLSLLNVVCEMAPYLLLGFLIAGILHVFVPQDSIGNTCQRITSCQFCGPPCWAYRCHCAPVG